MTRIGQALGGQSIRGENRPGCSRWEIMVSTMVRSRRSAATRLRQGSRLSPPPVEAFCASPAGRDAIRPVNPLPFRKRVVKASKSRVDRAFHASSGSPGARAMALKTRSQLHTRSPWSSFSTTRNSASPSGPGCRVRTKPSLPVPFHGHWTSSVQMLRNQSPACGAQSAPRYETARFAPLRLNGFKAGSIFTVSREGRQGRTVMGAKWPC